ncbi:MAG: hypothetical protein IK079_04935, partial [Desulfovibrio sp.]|nr:hypothetical protein [Desulfovibrio sp.]
MQQFPFWHHGWQHIIPHFAHNLEVLEIINKLSPSYASSLALYDCAKEKNNQRVLQEVVADLKSCCLTFEEFRTDVVERQNWCKKLGLSKIAQLYADVLRGAANFRTTLANFYAELWSRFSLLEMRPDFVWSYRLWRQCFERPKREKMKYDHLVTVPSLLFIVRCFTTEQAEKVLENCRALDYTNWKVFFFLSQEEERLCIRDEQGVFEGDAYDLALILESLQEEDAWVFFLHAENKIPNDALRIFANFRAKNKYADMFYADEDFYNEDQFVINMYPKENRWDFFAFCSENYIGQAVFFNAFVLKKMQNIYTYFENKTEFTLSYFDLNSKNEIVHIPHVLLHIKEKKLAIEEHKVALEAYFERHSLPIEMRSYPQMKRIRPIIKLSTPPLVSVLLFAQDKKELEQTKAILEKAIGTEVEIFVSMPTGEA